MDEEQPVKTKIVVFPGPGPSKGSEASDPTHPAAGAAGAPPPEEFAAGVMTVSEAARQLGVCRVTVHNLIDAHRLVSFHAGRMADGRRRQVRVSRASVERYLRQAHACSNLLHHEPTLFDSTRRRAA